jgi:hypothetical protein
MATKLDEKGSTSPTIEITPAPSATTGNVDDNYELYKSMRDVEIDPLEAKRVLRKVDYRILSLLMVTYILQYLDKNCINLASVYGLKTDTHLVGQDYSWLSKSLRCSTLFELTYCD